MKYKTVVLFVPPTWELEMDCLKEGKSKIQQILIMLSKANEFIMLTIEDCRNFNNTRHQGQTYFKNMPFGIFLPFFLLTTTQMYHVNKAYSI